MFRKRAFAAFVIVLSLTLILVINIYWLQVVNFDNYKLQANNNRLKILPIAPVRGLIYDRNGILLVKNKLVYSLVMIPDRIVDIDLTIKKINEIFHLDKAQVSRIKKRYKNTPHFKSVSILEDLKEKEVARFSVLKHRFPGLSITTSFKRVYPYGQVLTHVLGYVAHINDDDKRKLKKQGKEKNYRASKVIGKLGIERYYEDLLHGQEGYQEVEVDSQGHVVRIVKHQLPAPGKDLVLNIDIKLQKYVFEQFGDQTGSAIILNPKDNSVVAMASSPSYDPNLFVEGISTAKYKDLLNDPERPLVNRATLGVYPPGSTVKPFIAVAGLQEHVISKNTIRNNHGVWRIPGGKANSKSWRDWKRWGHGPVNVTLAIEESVNSFFYQTAFDLGIDRISQWMNRFGFGKSTGIDIYEESKANMPTRKWKMNRYHIPWYQGDTVPIGIGQGYWTCTPLQLAKATSILVNHGKTVVPHLLKGVVEHGESFLKQQRTTPMLGTSITEVPDKIWDIPINAMRLVNHGPRGSGRKAFKNANYISGGKSGTSQVFNLEKDQIYDAKVLKKKLLDQALYTAFAPYNDPEYVITVVIEHGNGGAKVGAPFIRKVLDYAFKQNSNN
ncbi:penicillin-binding protein 2 [Vibrio mediterranei]|jgi:penicillin-binding protein 2|uniref:penicillin-binding protein 2 n=1 Tax=Vibrio mediterranei TaxID=689 RepID=UPI0022838D41|nr:penicillin-binding protein 2 [Vibrio mediterranei]MCY9856165.1 penicillin-binding protein 2 [Vibrio mediterranei]